MTTARSLAIGTALVGALAISPAAVGATSDYKLPASGKWRIQNKFENTTGGSMTVSAGSKQVTALSLVVGPDRVEACGATVKLKGKLAIRRQGRSQRPAVGQIPKGKAVIEPVKASFTSAGKPVSGKAIILWERPGRTAFTAQITFGDCSLSFALRK